MGQEYRHFNTSVCLINYHFVWIPKRRKAELTGAIQRDLRRILEKKAEELDCLIIALEIMPDHVHLFLNCPPVLAPEELLTIHPTTKAVGFLGFFYKKAASAGGARVSRNAYMAGQPSFSFPPCCRHGQKASF
jgi:REP element-mobilizing transposase RayT